MQGGFLLIVEFLAAYRAIEFAGRLQDAVANEFPFHSAHVEMPQVTVVGIFFCIQFARFTRARLHAVRIAGDYQPVDFLHRPAGIHQFDCQPVEQFGVTGCLAVAAEIVRAGDNRPAEMPQPDMIDGHARRQRVIARCDPIRQRLSTS